MTFVAHCVVQFQNGADNGVRQLVSDVCVLLGRATHDKANKPIDSCSCLGLVGKRRVKDDLPRYLV